MKILLKEFPYDVSHCSEHLAVSKISDRTQFEDPSLVDNRCFINGQWVASSSNATFLVLDPVDDAEVARVPDLSVSEVQNAITAAHEAF
jgi:hypothetical protein